MSRNVSIVGVVQKVSYLEDALTLVFCFLKL